MSKKTIISASDNRALKLKFVAKGKESVRRKPAMTVQKIRRKAKQLAVTAKEKKRAVDRAKSEFMTIASHQLRMPLTAIRWALAHLQRGNLTKAQSQVVSVAHEAAVHMAETIRKMLMLSNLEMGSMELDIAQVELQGVLNKVARLHDVQRQRNGLEIALQCPQELRVRTDEQLLIEILSNLVSNAYKYTPKGGKVILCATKEGGKIRIDVADTGYGIPHEEQKRIPEKFFRASNITGMAEAGNGLGLYMVYSIARLIGGTISFVTQENEGTTFTLTLPSAPV